MAVYDPLVEHSIAQFIKDGGTIHCDSLESSQDLLSLLCRNGFDLGFNVRGWVVESGARYFSLGRFRYGNEAAVHTGMEQFLPGVLKEYEDFFPEANILVPEDLPSVDWLLGIAK